MTKEEHNNFKSKNATMSRIIFVLIAFLLTDIETIVAQSSTRPAPPAFISTITVAKDGSGNYKTIQEAVNSVRDLGKQRVTIYIRNGVYHEKLIMPSWKTNISLVGESEDSTIISYNDYSGKAYPGTDASGLDKFGTFTSYTVFIKGNDVVIENLTIENTAGRVGQAVALHVEGDRFVIKHCKLLGNQDTLYTATDQSRELYLDCYIEGTTDFIFGEATAVFQNCIIKSKVNSFVTAAATREGQPYGYVLINCKLIADTAAKKVFLGRPWRPYAKTVYINCDLGSHILPEGWNAWPGDAMFPNKEKTAFYAEYGSKGPGAFTKERVPWSKQLSEKDAGSYTVKNILGGRDNWDPFNIQ